MSEMCGCGKSVLGAMGDPPSDAEWRWALHQGEGATAYIPDDGERLVPVTERMAVRRPTSAELITAEYRRQEALSLEKNASYGDSALHPIHVFSKLDGPEGIRARLDDKLARHKNAPGAMGEREIDDLIGYLVLLNIAMRQGHE